MNLPFIPIFQHIAGQLICFFLCCFHLCRSQTVHNGNSKRTVFSGCSRQHPVQIGLCRKHLIGQKGCLFSFRIFFQLLSCFFARSDQDQFFFCPCHCHIKNAHLFAQIFHRHLFLDYFFQQCGRFCSLFQIDHIHSHSQFRMDHNAAPDILCIEQFSHSRHNDDRKFQTFTFVDTHDPDGICLLIGNVGLSIIHIVFLKLLDIPHKIKQALIAGSLISRCFCHQHLDICHSLGASRHGRNIHSISCFFNDLPQQIVHGSKRQYFSKFRNLSKEFLQFLLQNRLLLFSIFRRIRMYCLIKADFRISASDFCKFSCIQTCKRGGQHRCQRKILSFIIQNLQIIQKNAHLIGFKVSFPASHMCRNPFFCQHLCKYVCPSFDTSGQDHNIPILYRTVSPGLFIHHLSLQKQKLDPVCHCPCL